MLWRAFVRLVLMFGGLCLLFIGVLTCGVAMGDVGEEPNHFRVGVGKAMMAAAAAALCLAWWLARRWADTRSP